MRALPSGFERMPMGLQCRFGIGGSLKGPEMWELRSSLFIASVTSSELFMADFRLVGVHGSMSVLQPNENPLVNPSRMKLTALLSG